MNEITTAPVPMDPAKRAFDFLKLNPLTRKPMTGDKNKTANKSVTTKTSN
jgi:hypothetical protein